MIPDRATPVGMKIVVLDGHTLNPGDLDWQPLTALGDVPLHQRTTQAEIISRALGAEVILTNQKPLDRTTLQRLPGLHYVVVLATGLNVVDAKAARDLNVIVTNVPSYGTHSVAQQVFALLLELTQRTGAHAAFVSAGKWNACPDFCCSDHPLVELDGLTLGVVGFGRIGQTTDTLAAAFGMSGSLHHPAGRCRPTPRRSWRGSRGPAGRKRRDQPALPAHIGDHRLDQRVAPRTREALGFPDQHEPGGSSKRPTWPPPSTAIG